MYVAEVEGEVHLKIVNTPFFRFIIVGCINTLVYYTMYLVILYGLSIHYVIAHGIGFVISLVVSFFLNVYFTYKVKPTWKKFLTFPLTQVVNVSTSTLFLLVFVEWFHMSSTIAPLIAVFFTVPITYIVTKKILQPNEYQQPEEQV
ncbi:MAG TPA: GtrA family protein [Bacillota bacterium]|nr:GtrA family protein [Bacillota bacterium]